MAFATTVDVQISAGVSVAAAIPECRLGAPPRRHLTDLFHQRPTGLLWRQSFNLRAGCSRDNVFLPDAPGQPRPAGLSAARFTRAGSGSRL